MRSMGLRTAADIHTEYTAVRAAYLRALEAEKYSIGGAVSRSVERPEVDRLRAEMKELEREYNRVTGGGIKIIGVVPSL